MDPDDLPPLPDRANYLAARTAEAFTRAADALSQHREYDVLPIPAELTMGGLARLVEWIERLQNLGGGPGACWKNLGWRERDSLGRRYNLLEQAKGVPENPGALKGLERYLYDELGVELGTVGVEALRRRLASRLTLAADEVDGLPLEAALAALRPPLPEDSPAAAASPRPDSDLTPCDEDCLTIIAQAGKPLPRKEVIHLLRANDHIHGASTVAQSLARLVKERRLTNTRGRASEGYGLPEWKADQ